MRAMVLTLCLALCGCAGGKQACKECPATPAKLQPQQETVANEPLTDLIPATARAVLVVRQSGLTSLTGMLTDDPDTRVELANFLKRRVGADLTRVQGLVLFVRALKPPSGALVLRLPGPVELKGQPAGEHGGARLVRLTDPGKQGPLVAASHPRGLVLGTRDAVTAALDVASGAARPAGKDDPLGPVLAGDSDKVTALAGLVAELLPPDTRTAAARFGARRGLLTLDRTRSVVLRIFGEVGRLKLARQLVISVLRAQLRKLERKKEQAKREGEVAAGISAISSYHTVRRLLDEAEPRMIDGHLELRYQLPPADSAYVYAGVVGILAAVAIPAFIKYTRKAKTVEATEGLDKIAVGAKVYFRADHYDRRGRLLPGRFPADVGWTPSTPCCQQPGQKCQPDPSAWDHPTWQALHFQLADPHHYQFRFSSTGKGKQARFEAEARGDLDCDGTYSSYRVAGQVDDQGEVTVGSPVIENELE